MEPSEATTCSSAPISTPSVKMSRISTTVWSRPSQVSSFPRTALREPTRAPKAMTPR